MILLWIFLVWFFMTMMTDMFYIGRGKERTVSVQAHMVDFVIATFFFVAILITVVS